MSYDSTFAIEPAYDSLATQVSGECLDKCAREMMAFADSQPDYNVKFFFFALAAAHYEKTNQPERCLEAATKALTIRENDLYVHELVRKSRLAVAGTPDDIKDYLKGVFCNRPFRHFETTIEGEVFPCCPPWLPVSIGNVYKEGPDNVWHSDAAREVRRSILEGSYEYCSRMACPVIQARTLQPRDIPSSPAPVD
jgi:hypothetical protein